MQNPLKMLGDLNKMRSQAAQIQKDLEQLQFTTAQGRIKIVITGNQKVLSVQVDNTEVPELVSAINDAIRQSQQAAASKLAEVSKGMGLGG